ncbi:MAG: DciA family protein [Thiohalocapsa sp.]|jgi:hypothetical protein|uniref:DciA family protein n=1 Tax=Thiohalocapsa sp. TaxID=2497641 RepID=UPI0025E4DE7D|nr:DciA family protein [Thiohalocapsa sp.]
MPHRVCHVRRFLHRSDAISALLLELERRDAVLSRIRSLLPASVARHCTQAILEDGRLTLICDSPVWVDRLRFLSPQFLPALAEPLAPKGEVVSECRVRAQPSAFPSELAKTGNADTSHRAGMAAARTVEQTAAALGDSALAESLRRLAATLRRGG